VIIQRVDDRGRPPEELLHSAPNRLTVRRPVCLTWAIGTSWSWTMPSTSSGAIRAC